MKKQKLIHYEVAVSPCFPSTHVRKGEPTFFIEKIQLALGQLVELPGDIVIDLESKLHTIRKNYDIWVKRMNKVQEGKAVIDLFYWKLKGGRYTPDNEKIVFAVLEKDSGCGVQKVEFGQYHIQKGMYHAIVSRDNDYDYDTIANENDLSTNDGLSLEDFKAWFKGYDLSEPMAIIHFTKFRY